MAFPGLVVGLCLSLFSIPAAHADDPDVQTQAAKTPVTVSVPLRTIDTPGRPGQSGILEMSIGNAAPFAVMLDTGSVGLRLWGGEPPAATVTTGILGSAPMTIGGVTTTHDVPFQLISTQSPYIEQWKNANVDGILGIGVGAGDLTNPLVALPGTLGLRWSVHFVRNAASEGGRTGALVLGAQAPTDALMHFPLPYLGENADGARLWNDHAANGCWKFGSLAEQCVPTRFDSGFTVMRVKGRQFAGVPETSSNLLRRGTRVSLAAGSSAFAGHRFVAGDTGSKDLVRVIPNGRPGVNTGNSIFFDYTVAYDVASGDIYLVTASRKGI